jgi:hypothetical protein
MIASANLRSALFDNIQTRPRVIANHRLYDGFGSPSYRMPLERSIKPLPTLPHIVGNTMYDPRIFTEGKESPGTNYLRHHLSFGRSILPSLRGSGEPSNSNPTVL